MKCNPEFYDIFFQFLLVFFSLKIYNLLNKLNRSQKVEWEVLERIFFEGCSFSQISFSWKKLFDTFPAVFYQFSIRNINSRVNISQRFYVELKLLLVELEQSSKQGKQEKNNCL